MDPQNQLGFGWLLAPTTGSGNGILFCNADHQGGITTVTTVPAPVVMTMDNNRVNNKVIENGGHQQQLVNSQLQHLQDGSVAPIKYEVISKNLANHSHQHHQGVAPLPPPPVHHPPPPPVVVGGTLHVQVQRNTNGSKNGTDPKGGSKVGGGNPSKSSSKSLVNEEELARRREINRLREKRRREQMTPKERAKARKKNRLRARKRRRNMTPEEREEEKERNRERARQRRAQKLQQEQQQSAAITPTNQS